MEEGASGVFAALEEPTGAEEDWRHVDFDYSFSEPRRLPLLVRNWSRALCHLLPDRSGRVLIVDGAVVEHDSDVALVHRFSESIPIRASRGWSRLITTTGCAYAAFSKDGARVELRSGTVMTEPLVVEIHATTEGTATFPHLQVVVGENAEASVLVDYRLADGARSLLVPRVDLEVADSGRLRFLSVQGLDHAITW